MHRTLHQIAKKTAQMADLWNKYSFYCIHGSAPFFIKNNLRENRFFGQGERLVDKKGTYYVKNHAENKTKQLYAHTRGQQHGKSVRLLLPAPTGPKKNDYNKHVINQ